MILIADDHFDDIKDNRLNKNKVLYICVLRQKNYACSCGETVPTLRVFQHKSIGVSNRLALIYRCSNRSYRLDTACPCRNAGVHSPSYSGVARGLVDGLENFATLSTNKPPIIRVSVRIAGRWKGRMPVIFSTP